MGRAVEDPSSLVRVVRGSRDVSVVRRRSRVGDEDQGGAGVSDTGVGADLLAVGSDAVWREGPEALGGVDGRVGDGAREQVAVDETEVVASGGSGAEISGEDAWEAGVDGIREEGRLLLGLHRVDVVECQSQKAVGHAVDELRGGRIGGFNGLGANRGAAYGDGVGEDRSGGGRAITVRDGPRCPRDLRRAGRWVV